jgi:hypothetical protein
MSMRLFIRTIPPTLHWLASGAIVLLLVKVFLLNAVPEPVPGLSQLGLVFEGVLASILASYAFYLIVVHFKEARDRAVIYPHILRWACGVVGDCQSQLTELSKHTGHQTTLRDLTTNDVELMLRKVDPKSNAPLVFSLGNYANWMQYFEYHRTRSKRTIAKIMAQLLFLEAPLVAHLTKVDDCSHFSIVEMLLHHPFGNKDLSAFASTFFDYCAACRELDAFLARHVHSESST